MSCLADFLGGCFVNDLAVLLDQIYMLFALDFCDVPAVEFAPSKEGM